METHLTCLLLLRCPLLNPFREMHPPARWETQLSRDSLSYYIELCAAQRQCACGYDLLHSSWALSLEADVDPYGLIFEVLQVLNLHIYCTGHLGFSECCVFPALNSCIHTEVQIPHPNFDIVA